MHSIPIRAGFYFSVVNTSRMGKKYETCQHLERTGGANIPYNDLSHINKLHISLSYQLEFAIYIDAWFQKKFS